MTSDELKSDLSQKINNSDNSNNSKKKRINMIKKILKKSKIMNVKSITNRPVTLTKNDLPNISNNYSVTIKADGLRSLLLFENKKIFSIIEPFQVKEINESKILKQNEIHLIDSEFIPETNSYFVFDILIFNGNDVTNLPLRERLDLLGSFKFPEGKTKIILKKYHTKDISKDIKKIYEKRYPFETDGLIFTPLFDVYYSKFIYKWKPVHKQTIDFLVRKVDNMTFDLYISSNNKKVLNKLLKNNSYSELFPFIKQNARYFPAKFSPKSRFTIKNSHPENKINFLQDNVIYEFSIRNNEWFPYRFREDKTKGYLENFKKGVYEVNKGPNSWRTASSIYRELENPVKLSDLENLHSSQYYKNIGRKGLKLNLYSFNNFVKNNIFRKYIKKNNSVLDLAGGRGGDIFKISNAGARYLLHLDIENDLLKEAKRRIDVVGNKINVDFLQFDLLENNISKINKIRKATKFDVISCQFAFHYFCKNKKSIDFIINIISKYIKKNGFFIMTGFDGQKIFNELIDETKLEYYFDGKLFAKINRNFKKDKFKNYGQSIIVFIEKIGLFHEEYLVNFDYIIKEFVKKKIVLVESQNFSVFLDKYNKSLSNSEKDYIKMHRYMILMKK